MDKGLRIAKIGEDVLHDLIECYFAETAFYLGNRLGKYLNEEDSLFITNEDIINYIRKVLKGKYYLEVTTTPRLFVSQDPDDEDFTYEDTELRIRRNDDDD